MTFGRIMVRWLTGCGVPGMLLGLALMSAPAWGQPDPPATVARLARIVGVVSLRDADDGSWRTTRINLPVPPGAAIRAEPGARAVLDVAASRISLDGGTEFQLNALENQAMEGTLAQGRAYIRLLHVPADTPARIHTPRGIVSLAGDGRYVITAGSASNPTVIIVVDGTARVDTPGAETTLRARQMATIAGDGPYHVRTATARVDSFMVAMMAQDPRLSDATPDLVRQMTGVGDLAQYGEWRMTRDFGAAWVPRVETGWVPYRDGVWAWVEPWGWTWVDDAPWGFAPFHYGRWAEIDLAGEPAADRGGNRGWAWLPAPLHAGPAFRPAYAPALVSFLQRRPATRPAMAGARGPITILGWAPLGPAEVYRPGFAASADFRLRFNVNYVRNPNAADAGEPLHNVQAATMVPAWAMVAARPEQLAGHRLPPLPPENLEPLAAAELPGPSLSSLGMTPKIAERIGLVGRGQERTRQPLLPAYLPALRAAGAERGTIIPGQPTPGRSRAPGPEIIPAYPELRRTPGAAARERYP